MCNEVDAAGVGAVKAPGDDAALIEAAVPEHNLPPSIGCGEDDDGEDD